MDDSIRIRSGSLDGRTEMPRLKHAETVNGEKRGTEIGYNEEEEALYAGTPEGNKRLCGAKDLGEIHLKISQVLTAIHNIITRLEKLEQPSE